MTNDARDEAPDDVALAPAVLILIIFPHQLWLRLHTICTPPYSLRRLLVISHLHSPLLSSALHNTMPAKMPSNYPSEMESIDNHDAMTESGYVSAASGSGSEDYVPEIVFTKPHLQFLNRQLQFLEPQGS
jgi:hypothetical protein